LCREGGRVSQHTHGADEMPTLLYGFWNGKEKTKPLSPAPYTLHLTPYTLLPATHIPHHAPRTPHPAPHTLHLTLHTLHTTPQHPSSNPHTPGGHPGRALLRTPPRRARQARRPTCPRLRAVCCWAAASRGVGLRAQGSGFRVSGFFRV